MILAPNIFLEGKVKNPNDEISKWELVETATKADRKELEEIKELFEKSTESEDIVTML